MSERKLSPLALPTRALALPALVLTLAGCETALGSGVPADAPTFAMEYPAAERADQVDELHGVRVEDPYRWLEDTDAPSTAAWLEQQDSVLEAFVADVPDRDAMEARILEYLTYDLLSTPAAWGDATFTTIRPAGKVRQQLWVERDGERRLVMDFDETLSETQRMTGLAFSLNGERVVVQVAEGMSRWPALRVLDTRSGEWLDDSLGGFLSGRGGIAWDADGTGFYYTRYEVPEESGGLRTAVSDATLYYHALGTPQSEDVPIYQRPDEPQWLFFPTSSRDGRYLILSMMDPANSKNRLYWAPLGTADRPGMRLRPLVDTDEHTNTFEATDGDAIVVLTSVDAPNLRLVRIDPSRPDPANWEDIVPEGDSPISSVAMAADAYVVPYRVDARSVLRVFELDGTLRHDIDLTGRGFLVGMFDAPGRKEVHFALTVLYDPGSIYALDVETGDITLDRRPELPYDPDRYTFDQVFYESFDGTRVPMFLVRRTDVTPGPETPTLMYGYGAAGWVAFPWYQPEFIPWLDMGGVYALPGIRGGGEYGNDWWEAGRILNKETVIGDYLAAAEFLVESGRTSPRVLVGNGGSASGVLPAVAAMRRPDLFAATLIQYPTLDMLRYHLFGGWPGEFGTADDPEQFEVLRKISPYHSIDPDVCYPPMLVQAGALDEVTSPVHAYKYAAAMQGPDGAATKECGHPQLLKVAWQAGHAPGGTPEETAETGADQIAFLVKVLGLDPGTD